MARLPRIKITLPFDNVADDYCDLEEARNRFDWDSDSFIIAVGEQVVSSYEELVAIARDHHDAEFLEVQMLPTLYGG